MTRIHWNTPNRVNTSRMCRWKIALFLFFIFVFECFNSSRLCWMHRHCPHWPFMHIGLTFISTNDCDDDDDRHTQQVCGRMAKRNGTRNEGKNAGNGGDGYLSKSKMPEISMKRLRNAFSYFSSILRNFTFPALLWPSTTLKQFISVSVESYYIFFSFQTNGCQCLTFKKTLVF